MEPEVKVGHYGTKVVESPQFALGALTSFFLLRQPLFGHGEAEAGREIRETLQDALESWKTRHSARAGALTISQWI